MRNTLRYFLPIFCVAVFFACNSKIVSLRETNARNEVPALGNLVFRFSQSLYPDSLLNRWDSVEYISFEPAIKGRFRWENPDMLVFSPSEPLPPATDFTAKFGSELLRFSSYDKVDAKDKISFHTATAQVVNAYVAWARTDGAQPAPVLHLYFNSPVAPEALNGLLEIKSGDKTRSFVVTNVGPSDHIEVRLTDVPLEDKDVPVTVKVSGKLIPVGGKKPAGDDIVNQLTIPSPFQLTILNIEAQHDGTGGSVQIRTSQPLVQENIRNYIKVNPAVNWEVTMLDDGVLLTSDQLDSEKTYDFELLKGLRGTIGGVLKENYSQQLVFGQLEPAIQFTNRKGMYLSKLGAKNIEVRLVNTPKVKIVVSKIYESNLIAAQRYGYYPKESSGGGGYEDEYYEGGSDAGVLGDVIYEKEIESSSLPKYGNSRLFSFNLEDRISDFRGIYHVMIRSTEDYWVRDSRFVSLSDLGIIAKEGTDEMLVFTQSIKTAAPVVNAQLTLYGNNNQVLGVGATDAEGVGRIKYLRREPGGFKPAMVIAKTGDDFNYLPFQSTRVNTSRFEVGGKKMNPTGLDAFVYAERDMYRPGETFKYALLLRDQNWKVPGELPLRLRFVMPNGKEWTTVRKNIDKEGSLSGEMPISVSALTGTYNLEVYTTNDVLLSSYPFQVEEFVPDRLKVQAESGLQELAPGQTAVLQVKADYFFGSPAASRKYETEIQLKQLSFQPKKFPTFQFGLTNQETFFDKVVKEGTTDAEGKAAVSYLLPAEYKNRGLMQAAFYATVFDEAGRPVSRHHKLPVYTQQVFLGLGDDDYGYYALRQPVRFPLIAVNKKEELVNGAKAVVKIIKQNYKTVLTRSGGYFRYDSQKEEKLVTEKEVVVSGEQTGFSFIPQDPGSYEIRVSLPGATSYISKTFYSYGSWGIAGGSFDVNTEGNVDVSLDKTSYKPGDKAKVLFKAPFDGRLLVTLENNGVKEYKYIEVLKRTATYEFTVTDDHLPNIYITATLIKPHQFADIPLTVAHGFQSARVESPDRKIKVDVVAAATSRSNKVQTITVKAAPGSMVSLAAVDNGILQVSDFKTPDPYAYFYQDRALGVQAYDLYPFLLPELRQQSSTGGDGELSMDKRVNPITNKRFKMVSFWSGFKKANGSGEASFEITIPAFSGELRLMAVSFKDNRFGAGSSVMKVADPLVLSTALPRFLSPGDTLDVPVTVMNTTKSVTGLSSTLKVEGPLKVVGGTALQASAAAGGEARLVYRLTAGLQPGEAKVKVAVKGLNETFTEDIDITVRPASSLQMRTGSGVVTGGGSKRIQLPVSDFMPGSASYELVTGGSPLLEWGVQLSGLLQYPYGCTEQTISAAFPQLYFADLAAVTGKKNVTNAAAGANVQEAIRKIKMRQLFNGSVMMWDSGEENWWATVYAAHFLIEAGKAGYTVEKNLLDPMLSYLTFKLRNRQLVSYTYNRDQQKKIAPRELVYSLFVLSLAGRPQVSTMNYYKEHPEWLSLDSRYMLAAAFAAGGDKARVKEILPVSYSGEISEKQTGGSFSSPVRDEALSLLMLLEAQPTNPQVGVLAKKVSASLKQSAYLSTQESVFSILALGKLARASGSVPAEANIVVNGKTVGTVKSAPVKFNAAELKGTDITLQSKAQGNLYYFYQASGISSTGTYTEEDKSVKVRRQFFSRSGAPLNSATFAQNDLVVVAITIENMYKGSVQNMVITDLLPACFEIENPRIKELPGMEWIKNASSPTAMDIRDDRIHFFMDLTSSKQTYYYSVRAVSPGVFRMGPASVEAMYDGDIHSYNGGGVVTVK